MSSIFYCNNCGRGIFRSEHVLQKVNLWDLKDYQAEAYMLSDAIDMHLLRRYDCSLHQGWYCCRFIMMRMLQDKFGTGDKLLVYADSVTEFPEGEKPTITPQHHAQITLTGRDFDDVTTDTRVETLRVVKLGGIWCPPCRLMDNVIDEIVKEQSLPQVEFFEVDIDKEPLVASRFQNQSIPYVLFYYRGKQIRVKSDRHLTVDGGIVGGHTRYELETMCKRILDAGKSGGQEVDLTAQ